MYAVARVQEPWEATDLYVVPWPCHTPADLVLGPFERLEDAQQAFIDDAMGKNPRNPVEVASA